MLPWLHCVVIFDEKWHNLPIFFLGGGDGVHTILDNADGCYHAKKSITSDSNNLLYMFKYYSPR